MSKSSSTSRGDTETTSLRKNVESQLERLLTQLSDLEDMKAELDEGEYESTRNETIQQMKEFEETLDKLMKGDMTLVSSIGSVQLAIQAAIRSSFKSPEVIRLFAKKETGALRSRLGELESDLKLQRISLSEFNSLGGEISALLSKLGEDLTPRELELKRIHENKDSSFEAASSDVATEAILSTAKAGMGGGGGETRASSGAKR